MTPQPAQRGRRALPPEQRKSARLEMRLTLAQRAKIDRNGGPAWVERLIDRARETRG